MHTDTARYLNLLEKRLGLLDSLASTFSAARVDVVALDLDGLHRRIGEQERLCTEIRSLDARLDEVQRQCAKHAPAESANPGDSLRCSDMLARLQQAQQNVKQLNSQHQALLRRSRRTVNALLNSYHSFAMTYSDPTCAQAVGKEAR